MTAKPARFTERPWFSSGPTAKRPGWTPQALSAAPVGRSNRSKITVGRIKEALELTRDILGIPADYQVFMTPASDTGAFEAAMWNLLGLRKVQVVAFENFGQLWADDAVKHLKLDAEVLSAPYGQLPDLSRIDAEADLIFPWNGTTSGVKVPDASFISDSHQGLVMCDATSAAFCMDLPWEKLDVTTFSFQKALGGEAGIGVLILSSKAVERLNTFDPGRAIPKVIRLRKGDAADMTILGGDAINTYSFLVIEDYLDALKWGLREGGLEGLIARCEQNFNYLREWVEATAWIDFVAEKVETRSTTSVCLKFVDPAIVGQPADMQAKLAAKINALLETEGVAYDITGYRAAPPGLRIWCGCTVDADDICALLPWLEWAYAEALNQLELSVA
ncbi:phosphoserine transaminase [Asticcacaulis endophyticus]|uniref:phosphoserine transaminase n=1 Tax=Asticcacaulis endophyticus TaxID=1395890 RepID=A0A918UQ15_9CAUL|nr:phosphoserine transaminase [Asticcacaulis endophyticus]GGZ25563.1 phosphoserine aminotransferase [Asticcacaulis endophyticus]